MKIITFRFSTDFLMQSKQINELLSNFKSKIALTINPPSLSLLSISNLCTLDLKHFIAYDFMNIDVIVH